MHTYVRTSPSNFNERLSPSYSEHMSAKLRDIHFYYFLRPSLYKYLSASYHQGWLKPNDQFTKTGVEMNRAIVIQNKKILWKFWSIFFFKYVRIDMALNPSIFLLLSLIWNNFLRNQKYSVNYGYPISSKVLNLSKYSETELSHAHNFRIIT